MDRPEMPKDLERFFNQTKRNLKRVPPKLLNEQPDDKVRSAVYAIGAALLVNWGVHDISNFDTNGIGDEICTLAAALSAFFFGKLKDIRMLCQTESDKRHANKTNGLNATFGGVFGGITIGAFVVTAVKITIAADVLLTGGLITAVTTGVCAGGTYLLNKSFKTKKCPHCGHEGRCNQRVCRSCYRVFYPEKIVLDCNTSSYLEWDTICQFFDQMGLSYLDAEMLVVDHFQYWEIKKPLHENSILVKCSSFTGWVKSNGDIIVDYRKKAEIHGEYTRQLDIEGL